MSLIFVALLPYENILTTKFSQITVLVYVVQCINVWFTNMKQEENMVVLLIPSTLMLSLMDSPLCPGSPC